MRRHPKEAWSIHALLSDVQTRAELNQHERDFISFLRSRDSEYGYNIQRGGEGHTGPHTAETRQKIADASKQMWKDPAKRELLVSKMKGRSVSPRMIAALIARNKQKVSPERVEKLRNSHIGLVSPRRKPVRCVDTDEIFSSLTHVTERFGGYTTNLSHAIKCGQRFFGRRFEYAA